MRFTVFPDRGHKVRLARVLKMELFKKMETAFTMQFEQSKKSNNHSSWTNWTNSPESPESPESLKSPESPESIEGGMMFIILRHL